MAVIRIAPIVVFLSVESDAAKYICVALIGLLLAQHSPVLSAMLMSVNMPEARGLAVSICCSFEDLSRAVGPVLLGAIVGSSAADPEIQKTMLRWSLAIWVIVGLVIMTTSNSLEKDERKIQALEDELTEAAKRRAERKESLDAITSSVMRTRDVFKPPRTSTTL
jgi:predicted MFS family arabinose efflux permease